MDCRKARDWLLRAEKPRGDRHAPANLKKHLKHCRVCSALAVDLERLEQAWRALPLPPEAHTARDAFLLRLPLGAGTAPPAQQPSFLRRLRPTPWVAAAAVILVAVGLSAWLLLSLPRAEAAPDVVERLIDWNLSLAQASTLEERKGQAGKEAELKAMLDAAALSPEDRELSTELFANGSWLAANADPVGEADKFTAVAEHLQKRMKSALDSGTDHEWIRCAKHYRLLSEKGVGTVMERLRKMDQFSDEQKQRLKGLMQREDCRERELENLLERAPKGARPAIRDALDFFRKMPRFKGFKGHKGGR